jgi:hypothetical protein
MALPNRMSLRPGLLWLTLNLALITVQCFSRNNIYFLFYISRKTYSRTPKMSSRTPGVRMPRLKSSVLGNERAVLDLLTCGSLEPSYHLHYTFPSSLSFYRSFINSLRPATHSNHSPHICALQRPFANRFQSISL